MSAPISLEEVDKTFNSCLGAPGPDGFRGLLLDKANREQMRKCLKFLWNKVWEQGIFVTEWKHELRTVMAKPGKENYHKINAYRTISLTAVLGKRMEKITSNRLKAVLISSNFDPNQFAYLENRSANQAILMLTETVQEGLNQGKSVGAVFFDFSDAFGCVDRFRLLQKLHSDFKITGRLFLHISDFLSDRKARLNIRGNKGGWLDSNIGTSAGTVLGPLLFVAFTHDVPKQVKPKFADDLTVVEIAMSENERRDKLQSHIDEMAEWAVENGMQLNSKTKVMAFGKSSQNLNLTMHGEPLEQVKLQKYLGIWVDEELKFDKQAEYACGKAKSSTNKVLRLFNGRNGLPIKIGIKTYKALVRPHLENGIAGWG